MSIPESVTIVGGGVVGCFLAYRLALEGVPVTLIERQHVGAGASGASAGNVQPGDVETALAAESLGLFRRFVPRIKRKAVLIRWTTMCSMFTRHLMSRAWRRRSSLPPRYSRRACG